MKTKQFILMFAAMLLFLTINSQYAYCQMLETNKYVDKSDELPGIIDGEVFLIAGGVIVTGLITYLIFKNRKEKSSKNSFGDQPGYLLARSSTIEGSSFYDKMKRVSERSPVEIFTSTSDPNSPKDFNIHTGIAVGMRFKF